MPKPISKSMTVSWRTPISTDARPKLVSPCNVLGRILGDAQRLAQVKPGDRVSVEPL